MSLRESQLKSFFRSLQKLEEEFNVHLADAEVTNRTTGSFEGFMERSGSDIALVADEIIFEVCSDEE